ncbi:MAG: L,D-transpeptidase family protein [Pseudomonadota bacterium]|nr:L,D-transpeptidase family protein [Pseudomonadota bacterium]
MKLIHYGTLLVLLFLISMSNLSFGRERADPQTKISDVIGEVFLAETMYEDTLSDLARAYDQGYNEIKLANPMVDPWLPGEGTEIVIPDLFVLPNAARSGIVVNVPEMRLYYYDNRKDSSELSILTYPVSIGRADWTTPEGEMKVVAKALDPTWYPPESIREEHAAAGDDLDRVIPAGPDNPLGRHAIRLSKDGYLIHGTNRPYGIGMRVTHGCIRMYPKDVKTIFETAPLGTKVQVVNQPYKVGVSHNSVYLEVHPPLEEDVREYPDLYNFLIGLILEKTRDYSEINVDLPSLWRAVSDSSGVPTPIASVSSPNRYKVP